MLSLVSPSPLSSRLLWIHLPLESGFSFWIPRHPFTQSSRAVWPGTPVSRARSAAPRGRLWLLSFHTACCAMVGRIWLWCWKTAEEGRGEGVRGWFINVSGDIMTGATEFLVQRALGSISLLGIGVCSSPFTSSSLWIALGGRCSPLAG